MCHLKPPSTTKNRGTVPRITPIHKIVRTDDYSEILNLQVTEKPELAFCMKWLFWHLAQSTVNGEKYAGFQTPHIRLEGGEAVIGAVEFNGDDAAFDAVFGIAQEEPTPEDTPTRDPDPTPDPLPEPTTQQLISESVKRLADIHGTIADILDKDA